MIYATYRPMGETWEAVEEFYDLEEAMEILEFFAKGRPWIISSKRSELQALIDAQERQILAEEVEAALRIGTDSGRRRNGASYPAS